MKKVNAGSVKKIAPEGRERNGADTRVPWRAVERIADNSMSQGGKMDAELMGAAGMQASLDEREGAEAQAGAPVRKRRAPLTPTGSHARAATQVARHGKLDAPGILLEQAVEQSHVGLLDVAFAKLGDQSMMRFIGAGDDEHAGSFLVETMNDARAERPSGGGKAAEAVQERAGQSAASGACSRMDDHAGGLVDHGDLRVFVKHVDGDGFGEKLERLFRGKLDDNGLAALEAVRRLAGKAVDADAALVHELLQTRAAELGETRGKEAIEAKARLLRLNGEEALGSRSFRRRFVHGRQALRGRYRRACA
jgi:hypothetical protein